MSTSREIRQAFLDFYASRGHEVVPSAPLVPANDPTLMFANAGMVPFKDVFTGKDKRPYQRATSSQKCMRISGKHNDLENVGVTARHHTLFEMLGNFSFGDYFKREAIQSAWEFVQQMEIPVERLVVTVFGGEGDLPADEEAAQIWAEVANLPPERIIRCGAKDNFWQMGDTGPCGPCSELHYYLGEGNGDVSDFGEEPDDSGEGWFEFWNLVFMQYDRQEGGELKPLPAPSVDTGMGLERMCVIKQGVTSNYDTDLLRPIVELASEIAGKPYGATQEPDDTSMRVIADHSRTTAFLIAEGVFPDREGRSYVLRRVMRRAIRHGHRLGIDEPFLHRCAVKVVEMMGDVYPELEERKALIADITLQEEERFRRTLKRGLELLESNEEWTGQEGARTLPGQIAFKLYDTYGFPLDLQQVIGADQGFEIDQDGFNAAMQEARAKSQGSKVGESSVREVYREAADAVPEIHFTGYDRESDQATLAAIITEAGLVDHLSEGQEAGLVFASTCFYGEQGGQVGDRGEIRLGDDAVFSVEDTQKPHGALVVHQGRLSSGELKVGDEVELQVDHATRSATRRNHSATHLMHWALREVVGERAMQKGSMVGPDRLRFDYSGSSPLSEEQIQRIENLVNGAILANTPAMTEVMGMEDAKARGAVGIFEEKYGDVVRMLQIGPSLELCGGTHVARTGDIGLFKILSESGLAAGVRRMEAVTGHGALQRFRAVDLELAGVSKLLRAPLGQTEEKIERLYETQKELGREIDSLKKKLIGGGSGDLTKEAKSYPGVNALGAVVDLGDAGALRELADSLRDKLAPAVVMLGSEAKGGKALLVCAVSKEIMRDYRAGDFVKDAAKLVGGGGGGRPDFAQAGGSDPSGLSQAVARVYEIIETRVNEAP